MFSRGAPSTVRSGCPMISFLIPAIDLNHSHVQAEIDATRAEVEAATAPTGEPKTEADAVTLRLTAQTVNEQARTVINA